MVGSWRSEVRTSSAVAGSLKFRAATLLAPMTSARARTRSDMEDLIMRTSFTMNAVEQSNNTTLTMTRRRRVSLWRIGRSRKARMMPGFLGLAGRTGRYNLDDSSKAEELGTDFQTG